MINYNSSSNAYPSAALAKEARLPAITIMAIEDQPKPIKTVETPVSESEKKESIVLDFDAIKNVISSQIGSKAEINKLELLGANEEIKLSAELDAGMLGGKILIEGLIVNAGEEIVVCDLTVDARGYVKLLIESNLSSFTPAIKKYFEKEYGKPVFSIQIVGSSLVIELEQ